MQAEDQIGLLLPCNVIVYENDNNEIVVASIDPVASMFSVDSKPVQEVAASVKETLMKVINSL